jgi:hypothetical protein
MIVEASKYTPARPVAGARPAPLGAQGGPSTGSGSGRKTEDRDPKWKTIAQKKPAPGDVNGWADATHVQMQLACPSILIPRFRTTFNRPDWVWQELREGGRLRRYLNVERHTTPNRWRAVARARHGFRQNTKSDVRLRASIPAVDYFRFAKMDKHFWEDPANLRSLKRDNPECATIYD